MINFKNIIGGYELFCKHGNLKLLEDLSKINLGKDCENAAYVKFVLLSGLLVSDTNKEALCLTYGKALIYGIDAITNKIVPTYPIAPCQAIEELQGNIKDIALSISKEKGQDTPLGRVLNLIQCVSDSSSV